MILKRKQRWRLILPLINREQNYGLKNEILLQKQKVKTGIAKRKKCLKEEKPKTKNENKLKEMCLVSTPLTLDKTMQVK